MNTNFENVKSAISETKAKANSQVVEECFDTEILVGHLIRFDSEANTYSIEELCEGITGYRKNVIKTRNIHSDVSVNTSLFFLDNDPVLESELDNNAILFKILTGDVSNSGSVTLTSGSKDITVTVSQDGIISNFNDEE